MRISDRPRPRRRRAAVGSALALLLLVMGCSPGGPEMVEVEGVVLYKNQPMSKMYVQFLPDRGPSSIAETDEQGRFKLQYQRPGSTELKDGAAVGKHRVVVSDMARPQANQGESLKDGRIPDVFSDPVRTPLTKEIGRGKQSIEVRIE